MKCLTLKRMMDFLIATVWCFLLTPPLLLVEFKFQVESKVQFRIDDTVTTLDHLPKESQCYISICTSGNAKHKTKVSLDLMEKYGSCENFSVFNLGLTSSNETNVYLSVVHCKDLNLCFVIAANHFICDKPMITSHSKVSDYVNVGFNRLKLKDIRDVNISFCKECKMSNQPCALYQYLNKMQQDNMVLVETLQKLLFEIDKQEADSRLILKNCSQGNQTLCRRYSILMEFKKLIFLLKRKCRSTNSVSNLHVLKMHRSKRDLHVGKLAHVNHQRDSISTTEMRPKREGDELKSTLHHTTTPFMYERVADVWIPKFNETAYRMFLADEKWKQTLRVESEWAYLCLVFLFCLIFLSIWCLRGFHSRNTDKRIVTHSDRDHYLTVKEVLYRKARYLPMFNHQGPLEEVLVHDCGTNPDSSRFDMIQ